MICSSLFLSFCDFCVCVCDFERENYKSKNFCVCDFERENKKSGIFVVVFKDFGGYSSPIEEHDPRVFVFGFLI